MLLNLILLCSRKLVLLEHNTKEENGENFQVFTRTKVFYQITFHRAVAVGIFFFFFQFLSPKSSTESISGGDTLTRKRKNKGDHSPLQTMITLFVNHAR